MSQGSALAYFGQTLALAVVSEQKWLERLANACVWHTIHGVIPNPASSREESAVGWFFPFPLRRKADFACACGVSK